MRSVLLLLLLTMAATNARVFDTCSLVKELNAQGFPRRLLDDWVCLIIAESAGNTEIVSGPNKNKSFDFGLFQINSKYWCGQDFKGGDCNVECRNLIQDDITIASACAKKIYRRHGFSAWYGWKKSCRGKDLPDVVSGCL